MQTAAGLIKQRETVASKYGFTEDGKSKLHVMAGKIGGMNGKGHAFAHGKINPSIAGAIGGRASKRTKHE